MINNFGLAGVVASIIILGSNCQVRSNGASTFDKIVIDREVRKMFDDYHQAIRDQGLLGEFNFLDTSDDFFWVPPSYETALNYDSVFSIINQSAAGYLEVRFHWDTLQIFTLTPELANFSGIVSGYLLDTAGRKSVVRIIESGTTIKRLDGWKLLSGQSANLISKSDQH